MRHVANSSAPVIFLSGAEEPQPGPSNLQEFCWLIAYVCVSHTVLWEFARFGSGLESYQKGALSALLSGIAYRPFVYRALVPALVRIGTLLVPQRLLVFMLISFLMFVGTGYCFRALVRIYYGANYIAGNLMGVAAVGLIPSMFSYFNYAYDPATIFLSSLSLLLLTKRQSRLFFFVFILSCLNKETSILLIPIFVMFYWREWSKSRILAYAGTLSAVFAVIRMTILWRYSGNPGAAVEHHFWDHQAVIWRAAFFPRSMIVMGSLLLLVSRKWRDKPSQLRLGLFLTLVPLVGLCIPFGFVDELRDYYEAYPYILLLCFPSVASLVPRPRGA
jgi:hypothetical protein